MFSAYRGTIDDEHETEKDALDEVRVTRGGTYGRVIPEASGVIVTNGIAVSAIMVTEYLGSPLIAYVLTAPDHQRQGLATQLVRYACAELTTLGWSHVDLAVTVGSQGESLYRQLGFRPIAHV